MTEHNKHGLMSDSYINIETQRVKSLSLTKVTYLTNHIATLRRLEEFGVGMVCTCLIQQTEYFNHHHTHYHF